MLYNAVFPGYGNKMMTSTITKAVAILRAGGLVAMPTETVYGLAADATNEAAVRSIFRAKERPFDYPLIVHLASSAQLSDWARDIPASVWQLAEKCWPGPLTLILKKQAHVLDMVTGGQDTVGIRIPKHPVAQALLQAFGGGLAAPSANKFTHISPTTAADVQEELGACIDMILDGGDCAVGLESTILDMTSDQPVILRPGMMNIQLLSQVLGKPVIRSQSSPVIRTAGMHALHYAPVTHTRLIATHQIGDILQSLQPADFPVACVTHTAIQLPMLADLTHVRLSHEAAVYAHDLYHTLRSLDHQQFKSIMIEVVPASQEWDAIRDRLTKAAARD